MAKKVYELARDMDLKSKEIIERAAKAGIELKSHMSTLSDQDISKIKGEDAGAAKSALQADVQPARGSAASARRRPPIGRPVVDREFLANREKSKEEPILHEVPKDGMQPEKDTSAKTEKTASQEKVTAKETAKDAAQAEKTVRAPKTPTVDHKGDKAASPKKIAEAANTKPEANRAGKEIHEQSRKNVSAEKREQHDGRDRRDTTDNRDRRDRRGDTRVGRDRKSEGRDRKSDSRQSRDANRSYSGHDGRTGERNASRPAQTGAGRSGVQDRRRTDNAQRTEKKTDYNKRDEKKRYSDKGRHSKYDKLEKKSLEKQIRNKHAKYKNNDPEPKKEELILPEGTVVLTVPITVAGFCEQTEVSTSKVIMTLMKLGIMANINQNLDEDTVTVLADDLGISIHIGNVQEEKAEEGLELFEDDENDLKLRSPIITVMGHVDHGKTSLLDAIRKTNVTASESGGITQHIGASEVRINGQKIVFLDTPGHEAFTAMRARGAHITDIAVLVVAADDGVMPQTVESISHAKAAGVPVIVAINKMDKPGANPDRVKQELSEHGVLVEEWGGDVISVPVSAKTGDGIVNLLEMILLQAEVLELKANPGRLAMGSVIEARLDKAKGPVATLLVTNGTLQSGQSIVAGTCAGRIRLMTDFKGKTIKKAGPATAVEILGLTDVPQAGDEFNAVKEDKIARDIAEHRAEKLREEVLARNSSMSLEKLFTRIKEGEVKELNLIIKGDVQGSIGALVSSLEKLNNDEVKVNIIHTGVGTVTESDIMLAGTSDAVIIGFNVRPSTAVQSMADRDNIEIRTYRVIYDVLDDVENAMKGMLDPEFKEEVLGKVQIRTTFKVPNAGIIGGAYVTEGKVVRNADVRLVRDGIVIHEGKISSLKRFKDDAKEVAQGYECGIGIENYNDIKEGDIIECFHMVETERK